MTPRRLPRRREFIRDPSHGSIFVYMIPPQNVGPALVSPVRNFATVSCKRETTTRFSVKSVCCQTGTGSVCAMFSILNHTCMLST